MNDHSPPAQTSPDLVALLGSRICHDLISPLGAIANGMELLQMSGIDAGPEVSLISDSVANANARIKFFRIAYGLASEGQRLGRPEAVGILTDISAAGRIKYHWGPPEDVSRAEARVVFLLLQCVESALAYGGQVHVDYCEPRWTIRCTAPKLRVMPELWAALSAQTIPSSLKPADVHFALVGHALNQIGRTLGVKHSETEITLSF